MADPVIIPQQPTTSTPLHDAAYYQNQGAAAQQSGTAAQAAQTNADYLANKLAVLPMYGDPVGTYGYNQRADYSGMSQANRAIAYSQEGNPLILTWEGGDANHRGTEVYLTPQEYQGKFGISQEQAEQAKHTAAFSQPRDDTLLSPAAQAITNQYNATRYNTITGGGVMAGSNAGSVAKGTNPFKGTEFEDSAASIAWEVSGGFNANGSPKAAGGSDFFLNNIAAGEIAAFNKKYGTDINPGFITYATNMYYDRAALAQQNFTSAKTGQQFQNNYWPGGPIRANLTLEEMGVVNNTGKGAQAGFDYGVHTAPGDWGGLYGVSDNLKGGKTVAGTFGGDQGITINVPLSSYVQEQFPNSKITMDRETGEIAIYSLNERFGTWDLIGGGGRNALQSGMFTFGDRAETPYSVSRDKAGTYILPSGEGMSRLGAEAYGGVVRTLEPGKDHLLSSVRAGDRTTDAISRYAGTFGDYNLANFADQVAGGKSEAPGARIALSITPGSPAMQYMDEKGIIPGSTIIVPSGSDRLIGGGKVGGVFSTGTASVDTGLIAGLPAPFRSTSTPSVESVAAQNEFKPSGFLGLGGLLPQIDDAHLQAYQTANRSNPGKAIIELQEAGWSSVTSTIGGLANRFTGGLSDFVYKPTPITINTGSGQSITSETTNLPTTRNTIVSNLPSSTKMSGGNQTITDLGNWLTGSRGSIDRTNVTAANEYNTKVDIFAQMQKQNPVLITTIGGTKSVTTETGGTKTVTTITDTDNTKTYASEWDKFVEGSGRVGRYLTGETLAKQAAYETTLKGDSSLAGEAKRGIFTIGTTVINKPAELAPAVIQGVMFAGAGELAPGVLAEIGAGTGYTARTASFLQTPGGASLAKAGLVAVFGSAYTYDVTNKFTATPEETKTNIYSSIPTLVAMYGGAGGFNWIGDTGVVRGASSPSGATFNGVRIQDAYFGGGRTPTGQSYAGAFSPTESYVFTENNPSPPRAPVGIEGSRLALPDLSNPTARASAVTESAEAYSHMDLSGASRPFSARTAGEVQAESVAPFRDTGGGVNPISIKTQGEPAIRARSSPAISQVFEGDLSGGSKPFTIKTQSEVEAGIWDNAELLGGDTSGRASGFSLQTENEYLSGLPRDASGKGDAFNLRTQKEIMSGWEQERALGKQTQRDIRWADEVVSSGGNLKQRVTPGFMDTVIDTQGSLTAPSQSAATWKPWKPTPQSASEPVTVSNPLNPQQGYAPTPEREPFSIPGASEMALSKELANMHPDFAARATGSAMERELMDMHPDFAARATGSAMERELMDMHPEYANRLRTNNQDAGSKRPYQTIVEREGSYTTVERDAADRLGLSIFAPSNIPGVSARAKPSTTLSTGKGRRKQPLPMGWISPIGTSEGSNQRRQPISIITPTRDITEKITPTSRTTISVVPYQITTPREYPNTNTVTKVTPTPWEKITPYEDPIKTIRPVPPSPVPPITPIGIPFSMPGGGSGGGGSGSRRRAAFMETFMLGLDMSARGRSNKKAKSFISPKKGKARKKK